MTTFRDRLKQIMAEKDVKAADIARATGITPSALSKYLSDPKKEPMAMFVFKIANYLDVSSEWLYGATDERGPFREPGLINIYEQLSDSGKRKVYDFASFILDREINKPQTIKPNKEATLFKEEPQREGVFHDSIFFDFRR